MNEKKLQKLSLSVFEALEAIEDINNVSIADRPVSLDDSDLFNIDLGNWLSRDEVVENRRQLASAISAEKWADGAKAAMSLLKFLGV